jgi:hypothetical protein
LGGSGGGRLPPQESTFAMSQCRDSLPMAPCSHGFLFLWPLYLWCRPRIYCPGTKTSQINLIPGRASAPPDPPNIKSAWRPPGISDLYWKFNMNQPFRRPPGALFGGSGGAAAPQESRFAMSQCRDSIPMAPCSHRFLFLWRLLSWCRPRIQSGSELRNLSLRNYVLMS